MKIHTNYEICKLCKGACCTRYAGIYAPEDFKELNSKAFLKLLYDAKIAIDWHESEEERLFYIRPRHIDEPVISSNSIGGICINWTYEYGCGLSEEERPYMCRTLVPLLDGETCSHKPEDEATKEHMVNRWKPYRDLIVQTIKMYGDSQRGMTQELNNIWEYANRYCSELKKYKMGV